MKSRLALLALTGLPAFLFAMLVASPKLATQNILCGPRTEIVDQLSQKQKQTRRGLGLISEQLVMELYASQDGNWTILASNTTNEACVIAAGRALHLLTISFGRDANYALQP